VEHKRDPKYGKILKCASEDCKKESFYIEGFESWTEHKGEYFCFKCSVDNVDIDWKNCFLTYRSVELERRRELVSKQVKKQLVLDSYSKLT
jgi:hypothetical protein